MMSRVYCDLNLRPRIDNKPVFIAAKEPFEESVINDETAAELRKQGLLHDEGEFEIIEEQAEVAEAPAEVEEVAEEVEAPAEEVEEVAEETVKPEPPKGVWCFDRASLEGMGLEALNALYKQTGNEHGITVRAYQDIDRLIDKLCSDSAEG